MPIVNILVTREGTTADRDAVTAEEKARLIADVSDLLLEVLGKPLESTFVTIQEVDLDGWGRGGLATPAYRARQATLPAE